MRIRGWCGLTAAVVILGLSLTARAGPAGAQGSLTLVVSSGRVPNGGSVTLSGTAPCAVVELRGHPGALGIMTVGPVTAPVTSGRFSVRVQLPVLEPDPLRPDVFSVQNFMASCPDTGETTDDVPLEVTGIGLARTGGDARSWIAASVALLLVGIAFVSAGSTIRRRTA